ncbi:hypothetical protein MSG28_003373 [Choristoneura fumiferana]|uniref:Uncharacterized protein n=1 Tax=Choristoneura fumiferana TaxID=7141 RepID=A0ACC0KEF3_CHOFU|nr:hypothetical protein MSG28_003373 [Choristoneura fumiferana]
MSTDRVRHPIREIRERSLQLLVAKLRLGWEIDDELSGARELLEALLAWFHAQKPTLQREALQLLLSTITNLLILSDTGKSGRPSEVLTVLLCITRSLCKRILELSSIDLSNDSNKVPDGKESEDGVNLELRELAGDSSPDLQWQDETLAALRQWPAPLYALETLHSVLTTMARSIILVDAEDQSEVLDMKTLNICLSLVESLIQLLLDCVSERFWAVDHVSKTHRDIAHKSCMVMRLLGDLLMKYKKSFTEYPDKTHHRVAWFRLASSAEKLMYWARHSALPPSSLIVALQAALLDPALELFYPTLNNNIQDVLQKMKHMDLNNDDWSLVRSIALSLMAHDVTWIRAKFYKQLAELVKSVLVGDEMNQAENEKSLALLCDIETSASDIMLYLLRGRLVLSEGCWWRLLASMLPIFPLLQVYAAHETEIGQAICKSLEPDIAECMGVGVSETMMGLSTGLAQILDVLKQDIILDEHGSEYVTRPSMQPTLEPSLRRSTLQQLSVMVRQQDSHDTFLQCDGLKVIVTILRLSLMVDDYLAFPDYTHLVKLSRECGDFGALPWQHMKRFLCAPPASPRDTALLISLLQFIIAYMDNVPKDEVTLVECLKLVTRTLSGCAAGGGRKGQACRLDAMLALLAMLQMAHEEQLPVQRWSEACEDVAGCVVLCAGAARAALRAAALRVAAHFARYAQLTPQLLQAIPSESLAQYALGILSSVLEREIIDKLQENNFLETCIEILVDFCNEKVSNNCFEPNIPPSILERRSELEVRAEKCGDVRIAPSAGVRARAPTAALVTAIADVLHNVAAFKRCPVPAWNEQGLYRLLFRCASWSNSGSDNCRVRAAACRALVAAVPHRCVRAGLSATKDCLHNLLLTLTPVEDAFQDAGIFCLTQLAQSATDRKHPDKTKDESCIEYLDNLKSPYFGDDEGEACDKDSDCQPEYLVEELCKMLMQLFQDMSQQGNLQEAGQKTCALLSRAASLLPRTRAAALLPACARVLRHTAGHHHCRALIIKAKLLLRSARMPAAVLSAQQRVQRSADPAAARAHQLLTYTLTVLQTTKITVPRPAVAVHQPL